jgi:phosphocarrier protein HPr
MTQKSRGSVVMQHEVGLHARPSVKLTKLAKGFKANIGFSTSENGPWIDAKSISKVMAARAPKDSIIHFRAEGADAEAAVLALIRLVESDFSDGQ